MQRNSLCVNALINFKIKCVHLNIYIMHFEFSQYHNIVVNVQILHLIGSLKIRTHSFGGRCQL